MADPRTKSVAARFTAEVLELLRSAQDVAALLDGLVPASVASSPGFDPAGALLSAKSDLAAAVRSLSRLRAWAETPGPLADPRGSDGLVRAEDLAVCPYVRELQSELASRALLGLSNYGKTMDESDRSLAQWLQEAKEEALDLAVYLQKVIRQAADDPPIPTNHPEPDL